MKKYLLQLTKTIWIHLKEFRTQFWSDILQVPRLLDSYWRVYLRKELCFNHFVANYFIFTMHFIKRHNLFSVAYIMRCSRLFKNLSISPIVSHQKCFHFNIQGLLYLIINHFIYVFLFKHWAGYLEMITKACVFK